MTKEEILKDDWVANNYGDRGRNWVNLAFLDGVNWMEEKMQETNEGQALLYAVEKTAKRTKREMIEKAERWLYKYFVVDHYGMSPAGFGVFFQMLKQAMEEENEQNKEASIDGRKESE